MTDLRDLLDHLDQVIGSAPSAELPAIIVALNVRVGTAAARTMNGQATSEPVAPDENLQVKEAARRLGVSVAWLYKHSAQLPFRVRIGRRLLFRAQGLEKWNRQRQGRDVSS